MGECGVCFEESASLGKLSGCEHLFCFQCLHKWAFFGARVLPNDEVGARLVLPEPNCPLCREVYTIDSCFAEQKQAPVIPVLDPSQRVPDIPCPKCERSVRPHLLFAHVAECVTIECPACQRAFSDWSLHVQTVCDRVPVPCCSAIGTFHEMQLHRADFPLSCAAAMLAH